MSDDIAIRLAAYDEASTIISDRMRGFEQVEKALAVVPKAGEKVCTSLQTAHYRASSAARYDIERTDIERTDINDRFDVLLEALCHVSKLACCPLSSVL